jgi:hypothetical protein
MRKPTYVAIALGVALGLVFSFLPPADASRNSSGTYALPTGNPVVPGTTISSTWANSTLGDISTELTDSLSRSGKGNMLAPLRLNSGTQAAPGLTWDVDPDTGLYRTGPDNVSMSTGATQVQSWTTTGTTFQRPAGFAQALVADGGVTANTLTVTGNTQLASLNVSGMATVAGQGMFTGGAAAVTLKPGSLNHTYMEFYANSSTPNVRSGYLGFAGASNNDFVIANEAVPNGRIVFTPSSGEIVANARSLAFTGSNPVATTAFTNTLTPKNVVKAWARLVNTGSGSSTITVADGFNVSAAFLSGGTSVNVTLGAAMANTNYAILVTPFASTLACGATFNSSVSLSISCRDISGMTLPFPFYDFQLGGSRPLYVAVIGAQ